ncbi:MAG: beta-propeller fold lactonase family protein [Chitinophagaceae bacterium]
MKQLRLIVALGLLAITACKKEQQASQQTEIPAQARGSDNSDKNGYVYTLSNQPSSNEVLVYRRSSDGMLAFAGSYPTGGTGTGGGLGNQGAIVFADGQKYLLAVNPGSNTISALQVTGNNVHVRSTVSSGGVRPVSITSYGDLVYVLNQGGNGSISGFRIVNNGRLVAIPNSTRPLSVNAPTDPAQISFVLNGSVVVITEKATNTITTYTISPSGVPGAKHSITSSTPTPFGFAPGAMGTVFISEAAGGAPGASVLSSYRVQENGQISVVEGSVGAGQTAACWVVITEDGEFAYTTNTGSNNLSSFAVNVLTGSIDVHEAIAATSPPGPIDAALSNGSKFLYVLTAMGHTINGYAVGEDGSLTPMQTVGGVPPGATGLAAK